MSAKSICDACGEDLREVDQYKALAVFVGFPAYREYGHRLDFCNWECVARYSGRGMPGCDPRVAVPAS